MVIAGFVLQVFACGPVFKLILIQEWLISCSLLQFTILLQAPYMSSILMFYDTLDINGDIIKKSFKIINYYKLSKSTYSNMFHYAEATDSLNSQVCNLCYLQ